MRQEAGLRWLASLLVWCCLAHASTFDSLRPIAEYSKRITIEHLKGGLVLSSSILRQHNKWLEAPLLQQYIMQIEQVLPYECCDYYTAVPLVKGLTDALGEMLDLNLPAGLYPVVRRSYISAIWLLQRSEQFKWNTKYLHKAAVLGLYRLYEMHVGVSSGRPVSFHHISKSGGTSLCQLARANGCKGPVMTRSANCILDTGLDGPIWVLKHDSLSANGIPPEPVPAPPPPPLPPSQPDNGFKPYDDVDWSMARRRILKPLPISTYEWFMYECPAMLTDKAGYGCQQRQEAAATKSATFFANEHTLSVQHGTPQVCPAFTNVVIVRDSLAEAVSLVGETSQVYLRLLRRQSVNTWAPPRWDLSWWRRWAPVVVSSYSTRTLLGPAAFCPKETSNASSSAAATAAVAGGTSSTSSNGVAAAAASSSEGASQDSSWLQLSHNDIQTALKALYSFDLVLELGSPDLIDISLVKLLGWAGDFFSEKAPQRSTLEFKVLSWEDLQCLAQQKPPETLKLASPPPPSAPDNGSNDYADDRFDSLQNKKDKTVFKADLDMLKRMIAEVGIHNAYKQHGVKCVITPLLPGHRPPQRPPEAAVAAAMAALKRINASELSLGSGPATVGHTVVKVHEPLLQQQGGDVSSSGGDASRKPEASTDAAAVPPANGTKRVYHIWRKHGFVLDQTQYDMLLESTAADKVLHEHAYLLQLLDAAWLTALGEQREYVKLLRQLVEDVNESEGCGFAGLNHMQ